MLLLEELVWIFRIYRNDLSRSLLFLRHNHPPDTCRTQHGLANSPRFILMRFRQLLSGLQREYSLAPGVRLRLRIE